MTTKHEPSAEISFIPPTAQTVVVQGETRVELINSIYGESASMDPIKEHLKK